MRAAVASYYRSQFLNTTLPGRRPRRRAPRRAPRPRGRRPPAGCAGRGVGPRRPVSSSRSCSRCWCCWRCPRPCGRRCRSWRRSSSAGWSCVVLGGRALLRHGAARWSRMVRTAASDLRAGLLARARLAGDPGGLVAGRLRPRRSPSWSRRAPSARPRRRSQLVPLALLVLVAMGIPANVAGWGPREGVAAWAFAAAGLGASQGVATAVVYGVMVLRGQPARRRRAADRDAEDRPCVNVPTPC